MGPLLPCRMKPGVLYIAGCGRSGSTLIERALSLHPRLHGRGEVSNLLRYYRDPEYRCACGETLRDCPVWAPVLAVCDRWDEPDLLHGQLEAESWGWRSMGGRQKAARYEQFLAEAMEAMSPPGDGDWMIDSSKTTRTVVKRPEVLQKLGYRVEVLHLVRDPRAIAAANLRGSNKRIEAGDDPRIQLATTRAIFSWNLANVYAERHGPGLVVRYEDFVENPGDTLISVGDWLGVPLSSIVPQVLAGEITRSHQLAGNRMKRLKAVKIEADEAWRNLLPWRSHLMVWAMNSRMANRYGYSITAKGKSSHLRRRREPKRS